MPLAYRPFTKPFQLLTMEPTRALGTIAPVMGLRPRLDPETPGINDEVLRPASYWGLIQ